MFWIGHELGVVQTNWALRLKSPRNVGKFRFSAAKMSDAALLITSYTCGYSGWWFSCELQLDPLGVSLDVDLDEVT